tara:strand:- start:468 stop:878 length:411 start_codon:yes stop_codon:yes gene_type:complete
MEPDQETMMKFQMFEQQMQQIHQQLQAVEQGIVEMTSLSLGLAELKGTKDKEIMAPIGRGIYAKAKLLSEELTVDVGGKNFVKKSIPQARKIIDEQVGKLEEVKVELNNSLESIGEEMTKVVVEARKKVEKTGKKK